MVTADQHLGAWGEKQVLTHLKKNGYTILETNYRTKFCEIDIIAKKKNTTAFIEVKTRKNLNKGLPKEAVTPSKQRKILLGASQYIKHHPDVQQIRFDVAEVYVQSKHHHISFIKNAFMERN